jgi:uncharacterized membrane protein
MSHLSIEQAFQFSWKTFKESWTTLIPVTVGLTLVGFIINEFITRARPEVPVWSELTPSILLSSLAGSLLTTIVSVIFVALVTKVVLKYVDGNNPKDFASMFAGVTPEMLVKVAIASILVNLVVAIGLIALIIPGIYLALRYSQVMYVIVDRNAGVMEAFAESAKLTGGVKWTILVLYILCGLAALAGVLALFVGLLIAVPVISVVTAHAYRQLTQTVDEKPAA